VKEAISVFGCEYEVVVPAVTQRLERGILLLDQTLFF